MGRNIGGLVAGIIVGFVGVIVAQYVINMLYPLPEGVNIADRAQMDAVFRNLPAGHFAAILLTYLAGGFVGALVARLIATANWAVWTPPVLIMIAAALNVFTYPHPVWAQIGAIVAPLVGGWLAMRVPVRRRAAAPAETADAEV